MDMTTFLRIERTSKLGRIGEQLAEERLKAAGFTDVANLNRGVNFPYADIIASRNGQRFLIGVKARNEFRDNGKINPCYNAIEVKGSRKRLLQELRKTEVEVTAMLWDGVDQIAVRWQATPAWITVAMRPERGTYSAYFGLVSVIRHRRSIPMKLDERSDYLKRGAYLELAPIGTADSRVTADLLNRAA